MNMKLNFSYCCTKQDPTRHQHVLLVIWDDPIELTLLVPQTLLELISTTKLLRGGRLLPRLRTDHLEKSEHNLQWRSDHPTNHTSE